jgi:hypothetical protein
MTDTQIIAKQESLPANEAATMISIIAKAASDPNVDVSKLEKLLDMQQRIMTKQAEIDFNEALARISCKMPRIVKGGVVEYKDKDTKKTEEAFKFARYEDIDKVIRPLLVNEGFSLSYDTAMREGGGVIVTGTLSHRSGHSRTASIPLALDNSGGKNNVQGMGSTTQYGKRYTMCMLLNIVTIGEDDDGTGAEFITHEQAAELDLQARELGVDMVAWLGILKAASVPEILAKDYKRAKDLLEKKRKATAGKK